MKHLRIRRHATSTSTFLDIGIYWWKMAYCSHRSGHTCIWYVCLVPILWNFTSKTIYTQPRTLGAPTMLTNPNSWQMCPWRREIEPPLQGRPISSPLPAVLCGLKGRPGLIKGGGGANLRRFRRLPFCRCCVCNWERGQKRIAPNKQTNIPSTKLGPGPSESLWINMPPNHTIYVAIATCRQWWQMPVPLFGRLTVLSTKAHHGRCHLCTLVMAPFKLRGPPSHSVLDSRVAK